MANTFADRSFVPGRSFVATVAFISIKDLENLSEGLDAYRALSALHRSIKAALNEGGFANVIVLSALTGAVIVIPDNLQINSGVILDNLLKSAFNHAGNQGLPLRVGLSHGDLLPLEDIDERFNFIGDPLNIAAKLSMSIKNEGLLIHESFAEHLLGSIDSNHYLSRRNRKETSIDGKRDEKFHCYIPSDSKWRAHSEIDLNSSENIPNNQSVNAAIVAYDLPNFSDGDLQMLSQRFRAITDVFRQLELSDKGFYFSPGGDGGIFILPGMEKEQAHDIAQKFAKKLEAEGINKDKSIWVNCRIGVHYGGILLYENAKGLLRPAGSELFVADKIAGGVGKEGKREPIIVFSEKLKEAVNPSSQLFDEKYVELPPLDIFNGVVRRYTARDHSEPKPPATPPEDLPDLPKVDVDSLLLTSGSPFVVGRPLRADERIFGRDEAISFIVGQLSRFESANIVGERRMGKTSLLNYVIGNRSKYIVSQKGQPLIAAQVDLQDDIVSAERFYGAALRELLAQLPAVGKTRTGELATLYERLDRKPEADYDEFSRVLRILCDKKGICIRPVIIVDEFERLLEPSAEKGFSYPGFFNNLRALIGSNLFAMAVASRRPLSEYFRDPARPKGWTSSFPTYFTLYTLKPLEEKDADALLLQKSDYTLTLAEATEAKKWAGGNPCLLQAAGRAWYEAKAERRSSEWAKSRYDELKGQSCMTGSESGDLRKQSGLLKRVWRVIFLIFHFLLWRIPLFIGRPIQWVGEKFDNLAAWLIGFVFILLGSLWALGIATPADLLNLMKKWFGL